MYRHLILAITILLSLNSEGQIPYIDSKDLLTRGVELYQQGDYKKSIDLYTQVNECDTNYATAVYEEVLSLEADSSFEAAKKLGWSGLKLQNIDRRKMFLAIAAAYDYLQNPDSALVIYDSVMKLFPNDNQPYYEEGILYFRKKLYDKALGYFQRSLIMNPNHFNSHYMSGTIYALQGRLSEALIAYETSLLMTQNADLAKKSISLISSITDETDEVVKLYHNKGEQYNDPIFDEIDQLVNSKLALSKDYKLKIGINDNIFRQLQVVIEKLKYDPADTSFVMQYYVPLLTDIYSKDMFESYLLLAFSDYGFESVDNLAKKKSKEIAEVKNIIFPYFNKIQSTSELNYNKRLKTTAKYHFYPSENLIVIGNAADNGKEQYVTGDVTMLRSNHTLLAKGHFNDAGKKDGKWTRYYSSGVISSKEFYVNDNERDTSYSYYGNGNLSRISTRDKDGNVNAEYEYNYSGWLSEVRRKLSDKIVEETSYYLNGQKEVTIIYEGGNIKDGNYTFYHKNGKAKKQCITKDGKFSGAVKVYFDNGTLNEEANYTKGTLDGPYVSYYESGQLKEKYSYNNGKEDGPYEEYYENGKLSEKGIYNKGKKDELTKYSKTGKIYAVMSLGSNIPVKIKFTDEDNKVIFNEENKKGLYNYRLFYPSGNKSVDMKISDKGYRDGSLTFYYNTGAKSEVSNYKEGNLEGTSISYYKDGKVKDEEHYANDHLDGYYKSYYNNGTIQQEGWYKEGKKQGLWKYYYVNGKLKNEKYFLNDEFNGYYKDYNTNGEMTDKYMYSYGSVVAHACYDTTGALTDSIVYNRGNGHYKFTYCQSKPLAIMEYGTKYSLIDGPFIIRYANDAIREQSFFKNDYKDSLSISYYPDGTLHSKGLFINGNKVGKWEYYNEVGELTLEENYDKNGYLDGKKKGYACKSLHVEYNLKKGSRDGAQNYYGENGRIAFILFYDDGDLTGYTYEGKDGKMLPTIKVKNGTANILTYYSNGQKSGEANFEQNMINGTLRIYYSNGQLAEERNLKGFDLNGPFKRYNPDGKLVYDLTYKDDEAEGIERSYDKDGNLIISASYNTGDYNGPTIVTNASTKKTSTYNYHYGQLTSVTQ